MKRVLLIDDEPAMAGLVRLCLDAEVVTASDLEEAIRASKEAPPQVVLLDLALGEVDGLDLLPALRQEPSLAGIPVVGFSVHESREREARERGVDGFVAKPFKAANLRKAVSPWIKDAP